MVKLLALIIASVLAWVPHWLFGDLLGPMPDFFLSTVIGGVAYVGSTWYLGKVRGDF